MENIVVIAIIIIVGYMIWSKYNLYKVNQAIEKTLYSILENQQVQTIIPYYLFVKYITKNNLDASSLGRSACRVHINNLRIILEQKGDGLTGGTILQAEKRV